jgi:UDP-N-acetylmuramyl tripeptide synthase
MRRMRRTAAVLAGKATRRLSRLSGRGGTTFPGDVARAIDPGVLRELTAELTEGAVLVTGTNGKTTTCRLVASLLEGEGTANGRRGARVVANRTGSNLITGATAAVVAGAGADGRLRADWAVFEIDEASLPAAVDEVRPRVVVVGNLFRDQLDRYGELELLARTMERGLARMPDGGRVVLNADDPRLGELGQNLDGGVLWYGLDDLRVSAGSLPHAADARTCPRCGSPLTFDAVYVGHDGAYRCPRGDFARPRPRVTGTDVELEGLDRLRLSVGDTRLELPLGGLYNAYNLLAAFAAGTALGLEAESMAASLRRVGAAFGRQERFEREGRRFTMMLAKNPTGFNEILRETGRLGHGRHFLVGLNDRIADGRDVSWIWDVDFELLGEVAQVVVPGGTRAHDMAVRLKYAGVGSTRPPQPDLGRALDALIGEMPAGAEAFLLCTYTAMLDLRALLVRRGWLRPYWAT